MYHYYLLKSLKFYKENYSGTVFSLHTLIKRIAMKKMIQCFIVAAFFTACNAKTDLDTKKDVILTDTSSMYKSNIMTDTGSVIETSNFTNGNQNSSAVANRRTVNTNRATISPSTNNTGANNNNRNVSGTSAGTVNNGTASSGKTTTVTRRRGWSHAAKDATIGGVGGAVTGAIISKKKGKGAIIGGVIGATGGYILGRSKDKKEGR